MNANPEFAKAKLHDASHAKDRARRAAWLTLVIALLLIITLAVALVDYWWLLPRGARLAGFALLALMLAAGVARLVRLLRRPASFKEVALDVEAQDPALGCTISTAAEYLSGTRQIVHEYEPGLVAALESQAGAMLAPVKLPYWRRLLFPVALCLAGFLVFLGFLLSTSGALTALRRTANPWSSAAYTQVEVQTGDMEIPVGRDVEVKGAFHGRTPQDPQFQWKEAQNTPWHSAALALAADGTFTNSLKEVRSDVIYRVAGGDAVSQEYRIATYLPATVKDLRVRLDFPTYTGLKPATQASPDITALRGSTASFTLQPNVKLSQARLVSDQGPPTDLAPGPNNSWTGALALAKDAHYRIELRDEKHRPGLNEKTNHIKVIADQPPKVEITEPGQDTRSEATNTVALKITASDDFGVADLRLFYHKLNGPEKTLPVRQVGREGNEIQGAVDLPLTPLGLKEFELVAYHVEARDNNTLDGPGVGKSPLYFIEITKAGGSQTNPPPPPQPQPGSKINLLVIQKQIIADTRVLANNEPAEKFKDLALREKDASGFGQLYLASMTSGGAPPAAVAMMQSAMDSLTNATTALEARKRDTALPPEEQALASLYQVLKLVPELENMPVQPPPTNSLAKTNPPPSNMVKVVLEAIKQQMQPQPDDKEVAAMMAQAQQLSQAQASINHLGQQAAKAKGAAGSPQSGRPAGAGQPGEDKESKSADAKDGKDGQMGKDGQGKDAQASEAKDGKGKEGKDGKGDNAKDGQGGQGKNGKDGKGQNGKNGQGKDGKGGQGKDGKGGQGKDGKGGQGKDGQGGQGKDGKGGQGKNGQGGEGKDGKAPDGKDGKTDDNPDAKDQEDVESPATDLAKAAQQQEELNQEASELADKLERLAGKDARLGHGIVKAMAKAQSSMKAAAQSLKGGNGSGGSAHGSQAVYDLNTVAAMLQQVLEANGQLSDVSNEDYPAEFEVAIRDYLKRLSYQE